MQQANGQGDVRAIYKSVEALAGKKRRPPKNLTTDGQGSMLQSATDVAKRWYDFLSKKFSATDAEINQRPEMPILPCTVGQGGLTTEEVLAGLSKMKQGKATGPDKVPIAVFKHCPMCKSLLVELIQRIWDEEVVSQGFGEAKFVMLFKNKGSADDPTKYRCLGMLNHSYKVLSQCMLARIEAEIKADFLPDWQAGFRSERGCRDNVLILRTLYDYMLEHGQQCTPRSSINGVAETMFLPFSAAFDSLSHKFIDRSLGVAGVSYKTRSMFRAMYSSATARTAVPGIDGETMLSE